MRRAWLGLVLVGCGANGPQPGETNGSVAKPTRVTISAEAVVPAAPPTFGPIVDIGVTSDDRAYWIDDSGAVEMALWFDAPHEQRVLLPFSKPVRDVIFVAHAESRELKMAGPTLCALLRDGSVECVSDFVKTDTQGARTRIAAHRLTMPAPDGAVFTNLGLAHSPSERLVCASAAKTTACWAINWDGLTAAAKELHAEHARAIALGIDGESIMMLRQAGFDVANVAKARSTAEHDIARILGTDPDGRNVGVGTTCALDAAGRLACVGPGVYGELGDGTLATRTRTSSPLGAAKVVDVAVTQRYVCAVTDEGKLACWGKVPDSLALEPGTKKRPLPMCPLDRAASRAQFDLRMKTAVDGAAACSASCTRNPGRDCMLGCTIGCVKPPYVFRHDEVCREPYLDTTLPQKFGDGCVPRDREPVWLTEEELAQEAYDVALVLSPAFVPRVKDALRVAVHGHRVCVLTRSKGIVCLE